MTKDEVVKYLNDIGHKATNENGVVVVWVKKPMTLPEKNKLRQILQSLGYRSSWAWRLDNEG